MHKIAASVVKRLQKESTRRVVSFDAIKQAKVAAQGAIQTIRDPAQLVQEGYHPVHACYIHAQNLLSVIAEWLLILPEMARFAAILSDADDEYTPSAPPMSPITKSYFSVWFAADVALGPHKETILSIILSLKNHLKLSTEIVHLLEHMRDSRMGIYEHCGVDGGVICLRDLVTQQEYRAINLSTYEGEIGQVWLVRLFPMPFGIAPTSANPTIDALMFTTPYISKMAVAHWQSFFARRSWQQHKKLTADSLVKYGCSHCYWLEFLFQAYCGVEPDGGAIFLMGLPDIGKSRPHFSKRFVRRLPEYLSS